MAFYFSQMDTANRGRLKQRAKAAKERRKSKIPIEMDYSDTYRENDVLEVDLEDTLQNLQKDENRALAEKGEQIEELRRQIEMISRLQEVVKTQANADPTDMLHASRATRYGVDLEGSEFREVSKMSKAQLRIMAERERFSAKNLFNNRRRVANSGHELNSRLLPTTALHTPPDHVVRPLSREGQGEGHKSGCGSRSNNNVNNNSSNNTRPLNLRPSSMPGRTRPKSAVSGKGYLRDTQASQKGRPMTAGANRSDDVIKYDDLLPPRSQSAFRSRSRRELELLSRLQPREDENALDEDGKTNWRVVLESRRRRRLQELRTEGEKLQGRVHSFLSEMDRFNKRPFSAWQ
ncbi:uncharacterized protein LOC106011504 [Aplysia californica]|uniref:Uncharacterized protein LOC106011504 n=1 Tax=Aplysia californica TaxID=6500 RepID=A0ABM1VRW3_APLCA|nr:uncharacterized protein LOC106011504 [Aplysia californica]